MDFSERLRRALAARYEIEGEIGTGGMADVFLARDLKHGRRVALKVLRPELAAMLGRDRFLAEIEVTARLQHPHILPLFDSGEADGQLFYVMPYIEGETLRERIDREGPLPVDDAVRITVAVAEALEYAHRHRVIHRDLKPENILLNEGQPLVADFGIALAVQAAGGTRLTRTGVSIGTPRYMSPEQATGEGPTGPRSDLYSLGAVLYEMLVGEPPFAAGSAQAMIAKKLTEELPSVRDRRPNVPEHVESAVSCALERLPADRFATAGHFAEALTGLRTVRGPRSKGTGRRSVALLVLAVGAGTAVGLALADFLSWGDEPSPGPVHFAVTPPPSEQIFLGPGDRIGRVADRSIALSPDGSTLVYVAVRDGLHRLHRRTMDDPEPVPIVGTEGARHPFFSPDGAWIGFAVGGTLRRVPAGGGVAVVLYEGTVDVSTASWGSDGTILFGLEGFGHPILRVAAGGGTAEPLTDLVEEEGETAHRFPHHLPDGRSFLFTVWYEHESPREPGIRSAEIAVAPTRGGEKRTLLQGSMPLFAPSGHLLFLRGSEDMAFAPAARGSVWAAPFDSDRLEAAGVAVPVLGGVRVGLQGQAQLALSGNGTLAYMRGPRGAASTLLWMDREGRAEPILDLDSPQAPPNARAFVGPRLSPDGRKLAFWTSPGANEGSQVWLYDLERATASRLTFEGSSFWPVWGPDGARVAFPSRSASSSPVNLHWIRADGGGAPERLTTSTRFQMPYSFSVDSRLLFFHESDGAARHDIWVLPMEGRGDPWAFLDGPAEQLQPALSPDGRWLAYVSNETGRNEVYVTDFPGRSRRWVISSEGGWQPAWRADGAELFYVDASSSRVFSVGVESTSNSEFVPGAERVLFDWACPCAPQGRNYDVTGDGRRFVVVGDAREPNERPQIDVVLHWTSELERVLSSR